MLTSRRPLDIFIKRTRGWAGAGAAACLLSACGYSAPTSQPEASQNAAPQAATDASYRTASSPEFSEDRIQGLKVYRASKIVTLQRTPALDGLRLAIAHELGHAFERAHGPMPDVSSEDFADRFAVNLLMTQREFLPMGIASAEEQVRAMQVFVNHASPQSHHGEGDRVLVNTRQAGFECALMGQAATIAQRDAFEEAADSGGWGQDVAEWLSGRPAIGQFSRDEWLQFANAGRRDAQALLTRFSATTTFDYMESCRQRHEALRSYLRSHLANKARFDKVLRNYERLSNFGEIQSQFGNVHFEYQVPQTEGAWILLAYAAPARDDTVSGLAYLLGYLQLEEWLPGNPEDILLRLEYCGVGMANAEIAYKDGRPVITICYELMENILENTPSYAVGNLDVLRADRDTAYQMDPGTAQRTEQLGLE